MCNDAETENWLDAIKWTDDGLLPVIAQDFDSGRILMFAWMNRESLQLTRDTGHAVYWSRSRKRLWHKGEESGNQQVIREMRIDCDADVLLIKVEQKGGISCHTGRESCFYRRFDDQGNSWKSIDEVLKDPREIYK